MNNKGNLNSYDNIEATQLHSLSKMRLIRHTGIYVRDLELMKSFYCRYFDMEVAVHNTEGGIYSETILGVPSISVELYKLRRKDGTMIELLRPAIEQTVEAYTDSVTCFGCLHIAFTVNDLDQIYKDMTAEGIRFISQPTVSPDKKAYVCFCRDPEGNYLELVQELSA